MVLIVYSLAVSCDGKKDDKGEKFNVKKIPESESEHKHGTRRTFYTGDSQPTKVCFHTLGDYNRTEKLAMIFKRVLLSKLYFSDKNCSLKILA